MEQIDSRPRQVVIREVEWPRDRDAILNFDTSFTTTRIYRLKMDGLSARFIEEQLELPLAKRYDVSGIKVAVDESILAIVGEFEDRIAAFMTVKLETWNSRAWITHLYVDPEHRNLGIGKRLISEAIANAKSVSARGLWLETQNFNYPAIQFYRKLGFKFCGFDRSLYDPNRVPGETAIYFSLEFPDGQTKT